MSKTLRVLHAGDRLPKSIFLAGPTPRGNDTPSWRPEAIALIEQMGFEGDILVPEQRDWASLRHYDDQITWEWEGLNLCTVALFWVPREIQNMPAFTTNVEFGMLAHSSKAVLGYPQDAPKMRYLHALGTRYRLPIAHTLEDTIAIALRKAQNPFGT